jgi:hypothetical protein
MSVRTAGIHGPQVRRRAERLADPTIVECPHPAGPEARFRRGKLRIGRRNGRILQAKHLRAAAAILGLDAPHVGKEHDHLRKLHGSCLCPTTPMEKSSGALMDINRP